MDYRSRLDAIGASHGVGASAQAISDAEGEIGELPPDYRDFLAQVGWASVGPQEIAGLGADLPYRWQDVVSLTQLERGDGALPDNLIAIHPDGGGNFACLDNEGVIFWGHDGPPSRLADNFASWFERLLAQQ